MLQGPLKGVSNDCKQSLSLKSLGHVRVYNSPIPYANPPAPGN